MTLFTHILTALGVLFLLYITLAIVIYRVKR